MLDSPTRADATKTYYPMWSVMQSQRMYGNNVAKSPRTVRLRAIHITSRYFVTLDGLAMIVLAINI